MVDPRSGRPPELRGPTPRAAPAAEPRAALAEASGLHNSLPPGSLRAVALVLRERRRRQALPPATTADAERPRRCVIGTPARGAPCRPSPIERAHRYGSPGPPPPLPGSREPRSPPPPPPLRR